MCNDIDWGRFKGKNNGRKPFERLIGVLNEKNYTLISDYYRTSDKVFVKCDKGHIFSMRANDLLHGHMCNKCSKHDTKQAKEEFYKAMEEAGYTLLEEYIDTSTSVRIVCDKGHEISIKPNKFKASRRCSICAKNNSADFKQRVLDKAEEVGFKILSEIVNSKESIEIECSKGHVFNRRASSFYNKNSKCPICNKGKSKPPITGDAFARYVEEFNYKLLGQYISNHVKVKFQCDKGHIYETTPKTFKNGSRCPRCSNSCPEQAKENFLKVCVENKYSMVGKYVNTKIKVALKCSHGHEFSARPNDVLMGSRCPKCSNSCPVQAKERFLDNLKKKNYKLTGIYTGVMNPVEMECNLGHKFIRRPNDINNGKGCRLCAKPIGGQVKKEAV